MSIIDTPYNTESKLSCLVSQGVSTVIRYYNFNNSRVFPDKCLTPTEARALTDNGMRIAVVFQQRQNQLADFSGTKGQAAGERAYRYAKDEIKQPAGSGIYFSVDFDASSDEIGANIIAFFEGIKSAFQAESQGNPEYRVGAYGSGLVCKSLAEKALIELTWLSMSHGFRGTRDALAAGNYDLTQQAPATTLCGLDVDLDAAKDAQTDFGAFSLG